MRQNRMVSRLPQKLMAIFILFRVAPAYLEPGSSSFLLKILISSLVGFVVFFRQIWGYARAMLTKLSGKQPEATELETAVTDQPPKNKLQ